MKRNLLFSILLFLTPAIASAATITLSAEPQNIGVGDTVKVAISVTSSFPVNAFSGIVIASRNLQPIALSDGNSIISAWIVRPSIGQDGSISFAGIVPGGFSGQQGKIIDALYRGVSAGPASVSLTNIKVLRNDGLGTVEPTAASMLALQVTQVARGGYQEPTGPAPEQFQLLVTRDPAINDGKLSVIFSAVSKGAGIDHYDIAEPRIPFLPLAWHPAQSPQALVDQNGTSDIYVRAVDSAGKDTVAFYPRAHLLTPYEWVALLCMLILIAGVFWYRRSAMR